MVINRIPKKTPHAIILFCPGSATALLQAGSADPGHRGLHPPKLLRGSRVHTAGIILHRCSWCCPISQRCSWCLFWPQGVPTAPVPQVSPPRVAIGMYSPKAALEASDVRRVGPNYDPLMLSHFFGGWPENRGFHLPGLFLEAHAAARWAPKLPRTT